MSDAFVTWRGRALRMIVHASPERGAPAVVFVHGMGMSASLYSSLGSDFLGSLSDCGLNVCALDLQGHGMSDGRRGHVPFRDAIANIREAVGFAAERWGAPVGLAGSGLGAFVATYAAIEDDRVGALACHTFADLRAIGSFEPKVRRTVLASLVRRARAIDSVAPLVRLPLGAVYPSHDLFEDSRVRARWVSSPRAQRSYTLDSLVSLFLTPDDKPAIESLTTPTFVVAGESDRIVPLGGQEELCARVDAELFVLGGAGHMLPVEHVRETGPRMGSWLRKSL